MFIILLRPIFTKLVDFSVASLDNYSWCSQGPLAEWVVGITLLRTCWYSDLPGKTYVLNNNHSTTENSVTIMSSPHNGVNVESILTASLLTNGLGELNWQPSASYYNAVHKIGHRCIIFEVVMTGDKYKTKQDMPGKQRVLEML